VLIYLQFNSILFASPLITRQSQSPNLHHGSSTFDLRQGRRLRGDCERTHLKHLFALYSTISVCSSTVETRLMSHVHVSLVYLPPSTFLSFSFCLSVSHSHSLTLSVSPCTLGCPCRRTARVHLVCEQDRVSLEPHL